MPENWKTYKLKEAANLSTGFAFKSKDYRNTGDLKVIRGKNITEGFLRWGEDSRYWNFSMEKLDKYAVEEGDIVVGMDGSKIGKNRAIVRSQDLPSILAQRVGRINAKSEIAEQKFLWQLINNKIFEDYINNVKTGTSIPHISLTQIGNFEIELPPREEQKSIASILSALDDKIELNLQMNKTLEEMAMALYKHWFVDFGPFQDGEFMDSEFGEIPKGWEVKELKDLIQLNPRLSLKKGSEASFVEMKVLPIDVMSVSDVVQKEFKGGSKFQNGDTLFARITPCLENGKTAFVDFLEPGEIAFGSTEFLVMRTKEGVSKYWTYCLARDTNFRNFAISTMVGTSGRQRVQNDPFLSYEIPQPPKEIFDSFSEISEPWFQLIRINTIENKTLTQLRDTLLPKLISGEVRVKDVEKTLTEVL
ncbi:restriction endonuclease subunit S [Zunongwangia sp. F363]|uniref:Restriction endonuclease subunit S n=1 Tax=Autumnicola tepida TaxID=3075595 RepID=A0ABU3CE91_9FLAO|nr:restriction endonuclease subunit S [Zunongwangia sp. F363]MDT0644655.1 restriction endonuclease subunit S [Zunongwangia sp. F363]